VNVGRELALDGLGADAVTPPGQRQTGPEARMVLRSVVPGHAVTVSALRLASNSEEFAAEFPVEPSLRRLPAKESKKRMRWRVIFEKLVKVASKMFHTVFVFAISRVTETTLKTAIVPPLCLWRRGSRSLRDYLEIGAVEARKACAICVIVASWVRSFLEPV